jgi:polysaccharide export outer membrane protein
MTLATALQMAGGAKENADVRHIVVTRAGNRRQETVDVWQMLVKGDVSQDVVLNPGDSIFVPKGGENYSSEQLGLAACQKRNVRVWGAIKTPGIYEMTSSDDLLSLISKAGGFCHYANTNYITLSRTERDGSITTKSIPVEAKGTLNESKSVVRSIVSPGDLIIIHRSIPKTIASMFRLASLDK